MNIIGDKKLVSSCRLSEFIDAVYGYSDKKDQTKTQPSNTETDDNIIIHAKQYIHDNITNNLKIEDMPERST